MTARCTHKTAQELECGDGRVDIPILQQVQLLMIDERQTAMVVEGHSVDIGIRQHRYTFSVASQSV